MPKDEVRCPVCGNILTIDSEANYHCDICGAEFLESNGYKEEYYMKETKKEQ